jgi:DHA1 family bicyclomycin/chloramphenicol resistance-like MFS transporter
MKNFSTIFLLGFIAVVGVFTLDVYLPGMPAMAKEFNVSITQIGFTFTGFSIAFAVSQLFHGVLSDRFGRKPVLLSGLGIAAISTLFCITAKSYESLFSARILQAVGISSFVVVNAIIRDLYT